MNLDELDIPTSILESAEFVMERARHVKIDATALSALTQPIKDRLAKGTDNIEEAFGTTGSLEGDANLVFFETAANFCFWAQDDKDKWKVEFEGQQIGGWYGLSRAFYKAVKQGVPLHDSAFMERLTIAKAAEIFAGADGRQIPLLEQRVNNIVEAARFLNEQHGGSAQTFLKTCDMSAPRIAEAVVRNLPSYRDGAWYAGKWVWILKRAQILPHDLSQLTQKYPDFQITGIDQLTAFADYRIPQVLRHFGVLVYADSLAKALDDKTIIPSQSAGEVEIRAATILACEQLKKLGKGQTSADVDLALWLLSQDMRNDSDLKPHHLTISTYY